MIDLAQNIDIGIVETFREIGALAVLTFLVFAWLRGLIFGAKAVELMKRSYEESIRDLKQERDDWRDIAMRGTDMADKAVDLAERRRIRRGGS